MLRGNQVGVSRMMVKLCQLLWKETGEGANPEQRQELMGDTQGSAGGGGQEFEAESVLCCSSTAVWGKSHKQGPRTKVFPDKSS